MITYRNLTHPHIGLTEVWNTRDFKKNNTVYFITNYHSADVLSFGSRKEYSKTSQDNKSPEGGERIPF